ncbi:MAG TPA: GNAT family N-acetyltransferase [Candidatus Deferrimicrobium sp.]|nr:GNAT family N-acetyltransferase [Candidatus Deferrimicrobium sp.]
MERFKTVTIRRCRKSDQEGVTNVCYHTGYMGEDAIGHFSDIKLFGLLFCLYYPRYEPEHCWVAEDKGKIVGYILGSPNTARQEKLFLAKIGWRILVRAFLITPLFYSQDFKLILYFIRLPRSSPPNQEIHDKYPAHLHIDILEAYQHKGIGTQLMTRFEDHMRKLKVQGIHLGTSEGNYKAVPFYKKLGYKIIHIDKMGMWPDAPEKRGLLFAKSLN